ncbi:hypothetical protein NL676_030621 [Syzygium grande]|nr:hypothetical protein NL676_030621 [Syzygium grande]
MEYIVAREEEKPEEAVDKIVIPQLVTLYLHNMPKLISFCQGKHISEWPSLKEFTVEDCKAVEVILGDVSCRNLEDNVPMEQPLLLVEKYLGLGGCGEMEYIVAREEEKPEEAADKIVIPQLVTLYLHNMPKLISFCQGKHISEWPSLKEFTVEDCKAVEVILGDVSCRNLEDNVPMEQPLLLVEKVEFPNMESMKISHMDSMEKIWLDDLASNAFSKLKTLVVEY